MLEREHKGKIITVEFLYFIFHPLHVITVDARQVTSNLEQQ